MEMDPWPIIVYGVPGLYMVHEQWMESNETNFFSDEEEAIKFSEQAYDTFLDIYKTISGENWGLLKMPKLVKTKFVTGQVRFTNTHLYKPISIIKGAEPKYWTDLIFSTTPEERIFDNLHLKGVLNMEALRSDDEIYKKTDFAVFCPICAFICICSGCRPKCWML